MPGFGSGEGVVCSCSCGGVTLEHKVLPFESLTCALGWGLGCGPWSLCPHLRGLWGPLVNLGAGHPAGRGMRNSALAPGLMN